MGFLNHQQFVVEKIVSGKESKSSSKFSFSGAFKCQGRVQLFKRGGQCAGLDEETGVICRFHKIIFRNHNLKLGSTSHPGCNRKHQDDMTIFQVRRSQTEPLFAINMVRTLGNIMDYHRICQSYEYSTPIVVDILSFEIPKNLLSVLSTSSRTTGGGRCFQCMY